MNKDYFVIKGLGGKKILKGEIKVNGAKNASLPLMASAIIFNEKGVSFSNVPDIEDTHRMCELMEEIGMSCKLDEKGCVKIFQKGKLKSSLDGEIAKRFRASVILTGPLLAKTGKVIFPHPGGCVIGARPIDLFIDGFKKMGAKVSVEGKNYEIKVSGGNLKGAKIFFKQQSVTATETFVIAGLLAKGETVLENCAMEPEITALCEFLISCGAKISGLNSTTLVIEGGEVLNQISENFEVIPDRIEAGSFLILGALCAKDLKITNCRTSHLSSLLNNLKEAGVKMEIGEDFIHIKNTKKSALKSFDIKTHEYPGFPTDLQAPAVVLLTQAIGEGTVFETIFEGRLNFTEDFVKMGATIQMWNSHKILVKGPTPLKGKDLESPDIRAGLAFIIAGIVAEGESKINNAYYVDRGYEMIEKRLQKIGVDIKRVKG